MIFSVIRSVALKTGNDLIPRIDIDYKRNVWIRGSKLLVVLGGWIYLRYSFRDHSTAAEKNTLLTTAVVNRSAGDCLQSTSSILDGDRKLSVI